MEPLLILCFIIAFFATLMVLLAWIRKARKIGLIWTDMNKYGFPKNVAGSGGLAVITGFMLAVLFYIALITFYFHSSENIVEIFALTTSILLLTGIGIIDDLLGWQQGGLSKKVRIVLCLFAAIPLMVISSSNGHLDLAFLGQVNLGLFYPLILIPLGIVGTSTSFNLLAGFNGLEAGQGILIIGGLSLASYLGGYRWLALIGIIMISSLLAFWIYNKKPAKIFPGDVLTYPIGGLIAIFAILSHHEMLAVFFFIPNIIEVILKLRGKLIKHSFGKPNKDNSLEMPYDQIYGLEHFAIWCLKKIKTKVYEQDVVYFIHAIQIIVIILGLLIFGIF